MCVIEIRIAHEHELPIVMEMQDEYNKYNLSLKERRKNGFLSLITNIDQLKKLNHELGVTVALCDSEVVGYEIPVGLHHCDDIPLFVPLCKELLELSMGGEPLTPENTVISGQICVKKDFRSMAIGETMHYNLTQRLKENYRYTVVEIDILNQRSMHFSQDRLGLKKLATYRAFEADWQILGQTLDGMPKSRVSAFEKITINKVLSWVF